MKTISFILFFLAIYVVAPAEQTPNQIAIEVIQKHFSPSDRDKGAENRDLSKAVQWRLNALMVTDQVSEEARICYAIKLIDDKIHLAHLLKSSRALIPNEEELLRMRGLMLNRLNELSPKAKDPSQAATPKAEPTGAAQPAIQSADKLPQKDQTSTPTSKDDPR